MSRRNEPDEIIEPMLPHHFDATTEYLSRQPGGQQSALIVEAARLVLVDGKAPKEVLKLEKFAKLAASTLSSAVKRYPKAFEAMLGKADREGIFVVVTRRHARALREIDLEETDEIVTGLKQKRRNPKPKKP